MKEYQSLSHTRWDCKYHVVFIPKKRKKRIFGVLRQHLGEIFRELAKHKEAQIVERHLMGDHVHICISIPPEHAVSNVVGYIKGKSAIAIARRFGGREQNFTGEVFWARGYFVSTVGLDETNINGLPAFVERLNRTASNVPRLNSGQSKKRRRSPHEYYDSWH